MVLLVPANGDERARPDFSHGVAPERARGRRAHTYPELLYGARARLVVLGCEVGGGPGHSFQEALDVLVPALGRVGYRSTRLVLRWFVQ